MASIDPSSPVAPQPGAPAGSGGLRQVHVPFSRWWRHHVVAGVDHVSVIEAVRADVGWSSHFAFMTLMSAGIAVLGLLLSSPAVVIGAMLISPLMGPIIGLGFALATFDVAEMRRAARSLGGGIALAVGFCAAIVLFSPLQSVTDEIAARTHPNLFDLLVALFSGFAGTYAMIRGRHGTIVGVAIATALMPPLAVVGFGVATANLTVLGGSFLLFFTNLMTIAAAAALMARLYGFATNLSPRQTRLQVALVLGVTIALAIPLGISLRQIAWETVASREARQAVGRFFGPEARLNGLDIDYRADPVAVVATVLTPRYRPDAERAITNQLEVMLGRRVHVSLDQVRTDNGATEAQQVAIARGIDAQRDAGRVAGRLALVAGLPADQVLVDRDGRRAQVRAAPLPGASMEVYRQLEARVARAEPDWTITLVPPVAALGTVSFDGEAPDPAGARALATAAWAARRLGLPVAVSGGSEAEREAAVAALTQAGVEALVGDANAPGPVALDWRLPEEASAPGA